MTRSRAESTTKRNNMPTCFSNSACADHYGKFLKATTNIGTQAPKSHTDATTNTTTQRQRKVDAKRRQTRNKPWTTTNQRLVSKHNNQQRQTQLNGDYMMKVISKQMHQRLAWTAVNVATSAVTSSFDSRRNDGATTPTEPLKLALLEWFYVYLPLSLQISRFIPGHHIMSTVSGCLLR